MGRFDGISTQPPGPDLRTIYEHSGRWMTSESTNELRIETSTSNDVFVYSGTELESMGQAHRYYRWILSYFQPFLGKCIIEIGAGTGNFARLLVESAPGSEFSLFEPAANLFPLLRQRFERNSRVRTYNDSLDAKAASLCPDTVVMVNVLEHIQDDAGYLRHIYSLLHPGGHLLLFVPALPAIYGSLDRAFEHFRRYRKTGLSAALADAGFQTLEIRYFNLVGVAAWYFCGKILKRTTVPARDVRFYDRWIVPPSAALERWKEPPVGQSLIVVAQKNR
jgi:SAM-dependent methyltransferase